MDGSELGLNIQIIPLDVTIFQRVAESSADEVFLIVFRLRCCVHTEEATLQRLKDQMSRLVLLPRCSLEQRRNVRCFDCRHHPRWRNLLLDDV